MKKSELSKNQKRMAQIEQAAVLVNKAMVSMREEKVLTKPMIVGLEAELAHLECQMKVFKDMLGMAAYPWNLEASKGVTLGPMKMIQSGKGKSIVQSISQPKANDAVCLVSDSKEGDAPKAPVEYFMSSGA